MSIRPQIELMTEKNAFTHIHFSELECTLYGDKFLRQRMFFENWQKRFLWTMKLTI